MSAHKINEHSEWLDIVKFFYDQHEAKGGYQVLFPGYRPDLSKALAHHLELEFYDYRLDKMQPLGWDADKLTLDDMTKTLLEKSSKKGLVAHNIEALLATKDEHERRQWLTDFIAIDSPHPIILPIAIYQGETLEDHPRICDIELLHFPKQSFIMRLAN